jgi:hypothetical protein
MEKHEENLASLLEQFKVLREEHGWRMSEPVRKLYERIRRQVWIETTPVSEIPYQEE